MKKSISFAASALIAALPLVVAAQAPLGNILILIAAIRNTVSNLVILVFAVAVVVFGWGIVKYLTAAGDATKLKSARGFLWWGVIGIFVLAALWGLLGFIGSALGIEPEEGGTIKPPKVQRSTQ